jgi:hypothetical protein
MSLCFTQSETVQSWPSELHPRDRGEFQSYQEPNIQDIHGLEIWVDEFYNLIFLSLYMLQAQPNLNTT